MPRKQTCERSCVKLEDNVRLFSLVFANPAGFTEATCSPVLLLWVHH